MPKAIVDEHLADVVTDVDHMAETIVSMLYN
jgi:chemotaxis response regulator CheB